MAQWPPNLPWSVKLLNFLSYFAKITHRPDGSVNRSLMRFMDWPISPSNKPVNGVISSDFTVDKPRDLYFRLYTPTAGTSLPVIFFIHGGGFAYNAPSSKPYDGFCRRLAHELSAFIISVNYRLSPEHRYPAQIEDCFDVLKFIDSTEIEEGFTKNADLKRFFIAGDSSDWMWKSYLPEGSDRDHPAANVFGPNSDGVAGIKYPATIVFKGGYDPLQDRQKRYYEGLKKYGKEAYLVECENAFHTFYVFPEVTESSLLLKEVKNFMQKLCESIS
ncbi:probable carboxylesterase 18 isoform X2 [Euphorbia lathyris]|uniref:probable carboxylesterase 18 isoform X2 n=1 Tax=Euphorbia lathyris TaxID=212925 RepID=UPI00331360FC